jgi:hypothetical protein
MRGKSLVSVWRRDSTTTANREVVSWVERAIRQPPHYPASRSELYSVITDSVQVVIGADTAVFDLWSGRGVPRGRSLDKSYLDEVRWPSGAFAG